MTLAAIARRLVVTRGRFVAAYVAEGRALRHDRARPDRAVLWRAVARAVRRVSDTTPTTGAPTNG